jgi:hypothetical protein
LSDLSWPPTDPELDPSALRDTILDPGTPPRAPGGATRSASVSSDDGPTGMRGGYGPEEVRRHALGEITADSEELDELATTGRLGVPETEDRGDATIRNEPPPRGLLDLAAEEEEIGATGREAALVVGAGAEMAIARLEQQLMRELDAMTDAPPRRSRLWILPVALVILALAGSVAYYLLVRRREARPAETTSKAASSRRVKAPPGKTAPTRATQPVPPGREADAAPTARTHAPDARAPVKAAARGGRLRMQVTPPVTVIWNGRSLGRTPLSEQMPAGGHRLLLRNRQLGIGLARGVKIRSGETTVINWRLRKGRLEVKVQPAARVLVDGVGRGNAPLTLELYEGRHGVRLVSPSGSVYRVRVTVEPAKTTRVEHRFTVPSP